MRLRLSAGDAALAVFAGLYSTLHALIAGVAAWIIVAVFGGGSAAWLAVPCALAAAFVAVFRVVRLVRDEYRAMLQAALEASVLVSTTIIPLWRDSDCPATLQACVHNGIRDRMAETLAGGRFRVADLEEELPARQRMPHE